MLKEGRRGKDGGERENWAGPGLPLPGGWVKEAKEEQREQEKTGYPQLVLGGRVEQWSCTLGWPRDAH